MYVYTRVCSEREKIELAVTRRAEMILDWPDDNDAWIYIQFANDIARGVIDAKPIGPFTYTSHPFATRGAIVEAAAASSSAVRPRSRFARIRINALAGPASSWETTSNFNYCNPPSSCTVAR